MLNSSLVEWFLHHQRKTIEIGTGLFLYQTFNLIYDFVFYPFALAYWGIVNGGIIVVLGSLVSCAILFWLYDRMRIDWLGANVLRQLEMTENKSRLTKLAVWAGKKKHGWEKVTSPFVFIFLTLPIDPLIVAVHFQKQHFNGLRRKDWAILLSSVATGNLWWLLKIGSVVELVKFTWRHTVV